MYFCHFSEYLFHMCLFLLSLRGIKVRQGVNLPSIINDQLGLPVIVTNVAYFPFFNEQYPKCHLKLSLKWSSVALIGLSISQLWKKCCHIFITKISCKRFYLWRRLRFLLSTTSTLIWKKCNFGLYWNFCLCWNHKINVHVDHVIIRDHAYAKRKKAFFFYLPFSKKEEKPKQNKTRRQKTSDLLSRRLHYFMDNHMFIVLDAGTQNSGFLFVFCCRLQHNVYH